MMIETIGATGMRVSELQYVTVENIERGSVHIRLKGKRPLRSASGQALRQVKKIRAKEQSDSRGYF